MAIKYKDINELTQKAVIEGNEKLPVSKDEYITPSQIAELGGASPILRSDLKVLRDGGGLRPGSFYRITDYVATTVQTDSRSANHPFDIIVQAISPDSLSEDAFADIHEGDTYFSENGANLGAWTLKYSIDNDASRFAWADTENGKGVVFRLTDEWGNSMPYDFKGIQFKRYYVASVSAAYSDALSPLIGLPIISNGAIRGLVRGNTYEWFYTFSRLGNAWDSEATDASLEGYDVVRGNIITAGNDTKLLLNNVFANGPVLIAHMQALDGSTNINTTQISFDNQFYGETNRSNSFFGVTYFLHAQSQFRDNTIVGSLRHSDFGSDFQQNTLLITSDSAFSRIGFYCQQNVIRTAHLSYITLGNNCQGNTINTSSYFGACSIGQYFRNNTITGTQLAYFTIGTNVGNNTFTNVYFGSVEINGQLTYCTFSGQFIACTFNSICGYVDFVGGESGVNACVGVDVVGSIRGTASARVLVSSSEFILDNASGINRRIRLEGDGNGNMVATWFNGGKRVGITKAATGSVWTPLPEAYFKPTTGIPASDIAEGVIPDVSSFITNTVNNLVNYYLKSETYTKAEVGALIAQMLGSAFVPVQTLPTASADTLGKIYLVPAAEPQTANQMDEYYTQDNGAGASTRYTWELFGSAAIDLSGYVTTEALNAALADYVLSSSISDVLRYSSMSLTVEQQMQSRKNQGLYYKGEGSATITWDGHTDGLFQMPSSLGFGEAYKVSDFPDASAVDTFSMVIYSDGYEIDCNDEEPQDDSYILDSGTLVRFSYDVFLLKDAVFGGIRIPDGLYFASTMSYYVASMTYNGDVIKKIEPEFLPDTLESRENKVGTITGNESDTTKYPNTKAVAEALATKQNVIDSTHKLDYSLIQNTPTIPEITDYADAELQSAIDTAFANL